MGVRIDESREHPAAGEVVEHLHPGGPLHPLAERGDLPVLDQQVALQVHPVLRVEQVHAGKKESFGG